ncbi:armadillo-type protein [Armillaria novae-zelandiae]|uniref:Armadillo-type protein n=1 Tax=Armillaria novae-zelandiae TaxID=153914 RepID=A0AA39UE17_9AGAR|nr:armadillo-type protein [Armillaria novae-zelandiae]
MQRALEKIRPHTLSSLPHQKTPATLLLALESTIEEQKTEQTATAYFALLLTTLDGNIQKQNVDMGDGDILPALLYLLATIAPFVSQPVLRSNLPTVLSLTAPLFPSLLTHAPPLRSQLSLYHAILTSLDRSQLELKDVRQAFASILQLCLDPRPKVRKRASDLVKDVLASPPTPLLQHPYADRVAEWVTAALAEVNQSPLSRSKQGKSGPGTEQAIHLLAFLRPTLSFLPPSSLPPISTLILALPRLRNSFLSQAAYSVLSDLCSLNREDDHSHTTTSIPEILKAILSFPPARSDAVLSSAWIHLIGEAMLIYGRTNQSECSAEVGKTWKTVWVFLESTDSAIRKEASHTLGVLSRCFTLSMIQAAASDGEKAVVAKAISQISKALDTLTYNRAVPDLLALTSSLIENLYSSEGSTSALVQKLCEPLVRQIGQLRTQKGFEYRESADSTLATVTRVLGPQALLSILPLNLEPKDREAGNEPRAYLLPLLVQPHPSPLSHFVDYFVPLSERMFDLEQKAETEGRQSESKVWNWAGFSGYCHGTPDLDQALTQAFSQLLSQLLYSQLELRPSVLKALRTMVDSNRAIAMSTEGAVNPTRITAELASRNIEFLRTQAESWLAVFFNVFGSVSRDSRNSVGDVIASWVSIAGESNIGKAYANVFKMFKANLRQPSNGSSDDNTIIITQDLLIMLLPHLSTTDAIALFAVCLSEEVLCSKVNGVQKRGYKILWRLVECGNISIDTESVIRQLGEYTDGLDRFTLLAALIPAISPSAMHLIPSLIPEAVLGTKEPSDKARNAAFDLIIAMGRKMSEGGVVKRNMIDGMDEDSQEDGMFSLPPANIEEFMMMVSGGLAGATPHMISATVTALSRLVFEFKDPISIQMHTEIFTTLLVFLTSANREIVKSILGFVKLAIHSLPVEIIRPHLKVLVPGLLGWSHDHKNHFKAKVRHIFERMLRRFSWEEVHTCAGEEEAAKVIINIKKRKERAKRKKANKEESDNETPVKATTGDAFEDVLYGSESELEDSDDEREPTQTTNKRNQRKFEGSRLRMDNDEPMDLLQGTASRVTNVQSSRRRKPGQEASRFKTDDDTGKLIIDDSDDDEADDAKADVAGEAYRESLTSVDGFKRGANGRVKFNKDTKKRRREDGAIDEDVEMGEGDISTKVQKSKRNSDMKIGHEFKAKRAGGDVKKGGLDPHAYLTLSQASKRGGRKGQPRMGITGKR